MGGGGESRGAEARREENLHLKTLCRQVRYKHSTPGSSSAPVFPLPVMSPPPSSPSPFTWGSLRTCLGEKSLSPAAPATQHLMVRPIPCISEPPPPPDFQMPDSPFLLGSMTPKLRDSCHLLFFLYSLAPSKGKSQQQQKEKQIRR